MKYLFIAVLSMFWAFNSFALICDYSDDNIKEKLLDHIRKDIQSSSLTLLGQAPKDFTHGEISLTRFDFEGKELLDLHGSGSFTGRNNQKFFWNLASTTYEISEQHMCYLERPSSFGVNSSENLRYTNTAHLNYFGRNLFQFEVTNVNQYIQDFCSSPEMAEKHKQGFLNMVRKTLKKSSWTEEIFSGFLPGQFLFHSEVRNGRKGFMFNLTGLAIRQRDGVLYSLSTWPQELHLTASGYPDPAADRGVECYLFNPNDNTGFIYMQPFYHSDPAQDSYSIPVNSFYERAFREL